MQATVDDTVIARADEDDVVLVEGNKYVPKAALADGVRLERSDTAYTCPWKGPASYWNVVVGDRTIDDGAWSYDDLMPSAVDRVGRDFEGHLAFDRRLVDVE